MISNFILKLRKSKVAGDSVKYTFLNFLEKAIPFLILPIITRVLPKEEVGYYVLYQAIVEIILPIMTLNIDSAILLNYYKLSSKEFKTYFTNGLGLFFLYYFTIFLFSSLFSRTIAKWISFPATWLIVIYIIAFFQFLTNIRLNLWRVEYKIKNYGFLTIGNSFLKNSLGLVFVFYTDLGWKGLILGHLIGYVTFGLFSLLSFHYDRLIRTKKSVNYITDILKVGFPLSLHRLGLWLGSTANRIIITMLIGTAATGSYGIGATFAIIVSILEDSLTKAVTPHLFDQFKRITDIDKSSIVTLSYSIYAIIIIFSFFVFVIGYFGVGIIFGSSYNETKVFILPLILAAMFKGLYKFHVNYIFFSKKTIHITKITLITGLFNIILAYTLVQYKGLLGAAYSLLAVSILQYLFTFYIGNKLMPMPWFYFISKSNDT
ncbi:oligosaccharide flippase family protein [uncultured Sunxiuqinia sp.]|uniref:lipopolysaccharide biosynthesis protein n=1 Tax=uncultured Sunxiuqinia sp. TaxID=1573825 RepID=UPI002AA8BEE2|nr:oligosaccharide flippase family protein [uncultured Sunxiuqinia sp.]